MEIIGDELFICDCITSEINVISLTDHSFKRCISTLGAGPKEAEGPADLIVKDGNLMFSDAINTRIKEIDVDGNLINNITGIIAYDLFQVGADTVVRTFHSSPDIPLLHKLKGETLEPYLLFDRFKDKYVKTVDSEIPSHQLSMNSKKIIYAF